MGANLCLLEDLVEGEVKALVEDERIWLGQLVKEVRKWKLEDVDPERVTWLRCYGLPYHVWNMRFFEFLSATLGIYVCSDYNISREVRMDVARIMIRTRCASVINEVLNILTNDKMFRIRMMEEAQGSVDIFSLRNLKDERDSESSHYELERCIRDSVMEEEDDIVIEVLPLEKRDKVLVADVMGDQILGVKEVAMFDREKVVHNVQNVTPIVNSLGIINKKGDL